jgi:hypothetical protein
LAFSIYGRTNTKGKSSKKLTALFADDFFIKKGLCTTGAETQLGKKLIWPPQKTLSPPLAQRKRVCFRFCLDAYSQDFPNNGRINKPS